MKTNEQVNAISFLRKLSKLLLIAVLIVPGLTIKSQESTQKTMAVYPTFGFGIGFFYPKGVNDYIDEEIASGYSMTYNMNLYMYLEVKGGLTFRLRNFDLSGMLEYDIAPKVVSVSGGSSFSFSYTRISPEVSANYYIPGKSGKNAFFIGGGINYSFMKFKEFNASSPGFKLQAGYSMQFGKFNMQPYVAFRYVKATDSSDVLWGTDMNSSMDLDYTGGQLGLLLSFHPRISYK